MKYILSKSKKGIYIVYTILFMIICSIAFYSFIKIGKSFIWSTDGFKQHYIILLDFNTMIRNIFQNGFSLFSWDMGLGLDVIGQYSYYILGDPFAYISLLFPIKYLNHVYQLLVILRIYCVGISFIIYCRYNKKEDYSTLIGAIIYTFCGYIFYAAVRHPYFTNPVIMLPLVLLGVDKILKENKYVWFIVTTTIVAIMNYYFLYMITILVFIYAIVKYIIEYRNGIKDFFLKFGKTALSYIIGVMIAGIILFPTIYAYLNSDRAGVDYTYYNASYYERLLFGQPNTSYWSKSYVAAIAILIFPVAILNMKKNKENKTILINIAVSIIILLVPFLGSVMNGFSFQTNRWIFGYVFYMAYLVVINLRKDMKYTIKEIIFMLLSLIIYMILALSMNKVDRNFILMSIVFAAVNGLFILIKNLYKNHSKILINICKYATVALVSVNTIIYAWILYAPNLGNYVDEFIDFSEIEKEYNNYGIKQINEAVEYIKQYDNTNFYRIGTPVYTNNNMNIKHEYRSLNTYLSIGNGYISDFSKELLVLGNNKTNCLRELDSRTKITTLLGAKYYIVSKGKEQYVPYGYELIGNLEKNKVYKNKNNLTIGVFYDNYILNKDYNDLSALEKEQALIETAVVNDNLNFSNIVYNDNLVNEIKDTTKEVDFTISNENSYLKDKKFYIEFDEVNDCELYIYFEGLKYDSTDEFFVKTKYNGISKKQVVRDKVKTAYYEEKPNILFNLGYQEKHKGKIKVELTGKGNYTCENIKIIAVQMKKYEDSVSKLKQNEFELQELGDDYIKGTINNNKSGILQISTSYSTGWKAYVNGKEVDVINVNTGFIGIQLEEGKNEVYFIYQTPWLKLGTVISISGIVILVFVIIKQRKRKVEEI